MFALKFIKRLVKTLASLLGYILVYLIPKSKTLVCFGDFNNVRSDSFELFDPTNKNHYFITGNREICDRKKIVYRWSIKGLILASRASAYVVNCYASDVNPYFFHNKFIINLWHGIPIKEIESKDTLKYYRSEYFFANRLSPKLAVTDIFVAPNKVTMKLFEHAFGNRIKKFCIGSTKRYRKNYILNENTLYLSSIHPHSFNAELYVYLIDRFEDIYHIEPHPKDKDNDFVNQQITRLRNRSYQYSSKCTIFESSLIYHAPKNSRFLISNDTKIINLPSQLKFIGNCGRLSEYVLEEEMSFTANPIERLEDIKA